MKWLNTCSVAATLGISSVFFYFGGTLPSWMASLTSVTNVSIISRIKTFLFPSKVNLVLSSMSSRGLITGGFKESCNWRI